MDDGQTTLSKQLIFLIIGSILFSACRKDSFAPVKEPDFTCMVQTDNPTGRSYEAESVISYNCIDRHCGIMPLSNKNYWVYEDSVFDNGNFLKVKLDTLRYSSNKKTLTDGLIWWESNISVGLPETLYANDSAIFTMTDRLFIPGVKDAKKDYRIPTGDSIKYLTSFDDIAANGRSVRLQSAIKTSAGTFNDCIYFEKNARFYRKDQVFYKPGFGVIKYIQEKAMPGSMEIKLQQVSTLVAVHFE